MIERLARSIPPAAIAYGLMWGGLVASLVFVR
jgi:hypothetical protein